MNPTSLQEIGSVIESAPNSVIIKISDDKKLKSNKENLQIGKYLLVTEGNHNYVVCIIQNIRINDTERYIINTKTGLILRKTSLDKKWLPVRTCRLMLPADITICPLTVSGYGL